jgi:Domain of unknown function (DUF4282)
MTERSSGQGRADDWARGYGGEQYLGEEYPGESYAGQSYSDETLYDQAPAGQGMPGSGHGMPGPGWDGQGMPGPGTAQPGMPASPLGRSTPRQAGDSKGFLSALFDFSFTSFVTTKIIKVVYVLILILASLYALGFTIYMFHLSAAAGLFTLIVADPLFIVIVMAFWRLVLESFIVVFRIAEDTRAIRERGENRLSAGARRSRGPSRERPRRAGRGGRDRRSPRCG